MNKVTGVALVLVLLFVTGTGMALSKSTAKQVGFGECGEPNKSVVGCECHIASVAGADGLVNVCYVGVCVDGNIHLGMEVGDGITCKNIDAKAIANRIWVNYLISTTE